MKSIPIRTCIACREERAKGELLRVVKNAEGEIKLDFSGKLSGRGAYVCNSEACIAKLKKSRLLNKSFSCNVPEEVYLRIEEEFLGKK